METLNVSLVPCNIPELRHACLYTQNQLGKHRKYEMSKKQ